MKKSILSLFLAFSLLIAAFPLYAGNAIANTAFTPNVDINFNSTSNVQQGTIRYMAYRSSNKYYKSNYWPKDYDGNGSEASTACISMALSYIGINKLPKEILQTGKTKFDTYQPMQQIKSKDENRFITRDEVAAKYTKFETGNKHYSPIVIGLTRKGSSSFEPGNYLVIIGKYTAESNKDQDVYRVVSANSDSENLKLRINDSEAVYLNESYSVTRIVQWRKAGKSETVGISRLYNRNTGEHFYTSSEEERNNLISHGWEYEGEGLRALKKYGIPVYRLFNPNSGDHMYTMFLEEKQHLESLGWQNEGVAFNSDYPEEGVPMFRLYNPNADCGSHHFTSSKEERDYLVSLGWIYECIGFYSVAP